MTVIELTDPAWLNAEATDRANGVVYALPVSPETDEDWLAGTPLNPLATPAEPMPALAGFPFATPGTSLLIVGPTGSGKSALIETCLADAALIGMTSLYLGSEITESEFHARGGEIARRRGLELTDELLEAFARVHYADLGTVIAHAWENPGAWIQGVVGRYDIVAIDPLSAVESTLGLNFEQSSRDYVSCFDRLFQPLTSRQVTVPMADNTGHAIDAKHRASGAHGKHDKADIAVSCSLSNSPAGLLIRTTKVRSSRAPFKRGDEWIFDRDTRTIQARTTPDGASASTSDGGSFRPTTLMEKVSRLLEAEAGLSGNAIRSATGGRAEYVDLAVELLLAEDFIRVEAGPRNSKQHYSVRVFRTDDTTTSGPRPDHVPDAVSATASHVPFPKGDVDTDTVRADELFDRHRGTRS